MPIRLVVVGGSSGGIEALAALLPQLPADFPAAMAIVIHTTPRSGGQLLSQVLSRGCRLPVAEASDGVELQSGHIYLPPADHHLLLQHNRLRVSHGPRENKCRPAIDPLFRSAAYYGREQAVGLLLSGMLDDGANGLLAIHEVGGLTLVQEPEDARCSDMPRNALALHSPNLVLPVSQIGAALIHELQQERPAGPPLSRELGTEVLLTQRAMGLEDHGHDIQNSESLGNLLPISCPDCGGTLWQVGQHFRCHTGHAYSAQTLLASQDRKLEEALWAAVRSLEERRKTLDTIRAQAVRAQKSSTPQLYAERADEAQRYADRIRALLLRMAEGTV